MKTVIKSLLFVAALFSGCRAAIVTDQPTAEATIAPASPGPAYVWINDSWDWDNQSRVYVARPGYWTKPARRNVAWVDGHWVRARGGGWKYVRGHWRRK